MPKNLHIRYRFVKLLPGMTASTRTTADPVSRTVAGAVAARLREAIVAGELASGMKLRQVQLAERFGVSTTKPRCATDE
jgi:DNA-binding GntR family transcriptional regulator